MKPYMVITINSKFLYIGLSLIVLGFGLKYAYHYAYMKGAQEMYQYIQNEAAAESQPSSHPS